MRQGKNHRERYVPITAQALNTLQNYLLEARPQLTNNQKNSAFFVSQQGHRCGGQTLALSLNKLCQAAGVAEIGLHSLRHSIATHLLARGMRLSQIAKFLGHSSLESTQIYTRIIENEETL